MRATDKRQISILGRGAVGSALGGRLLSGGRTLVYGVQNPSGPDEKSVREACEASDIILLAVPWKAVGSVLNEAGSLDRKILIDCTNPLAMKDGLLRLAPDSEPSGSERIAELAPGALVFKTFNQTGAETMADPERYGAPPMMFVAGDHASAKEKVIELIRLTGFEALDAGPLANARLLEALAVLWIDQSTARGQGRDFAFVRAHPARP